MKLQAQQWLEDARTQQLLAAFSDVPLRFVGGCVRDAIMGRTVGDVDCATPALPEQTLMLLQKAGIKALPTGIAHGTITAIIEGKPFEITTLRRDVACDGRHAEVAFTDDWQSDALRRDFTLNALFCDPQGHIEDFTGGISDAHAGRIRFIGDAAARIREDSLRILRFFRFTATHGNPLLPVDAEGLTACGAQRQLLAQLSGERIQREMLKLLAAPNPYPALQAMRQSGVLDTLFSTHETILHPLLFAVQESGIALLRLAMILPDAKAAEALAQRWRLSNHDRALLLLLITHPCRDWPLNPTDMIRIARHLKPAEYRLLLARNATLLHKSEDDLQRAIACFEALDMPVFPITGGDVMALGIPAGSKVGAALKTLEAAWEASDYTLSKERLLKQL